MLALPVLLLSLTVHEVSHGYAALKCGDTTARNLGRLTLNPLAHLDLRGAVMMLIVGIGWAKPVPVNPRNFRHPRTDIALVSLAGPLSNILMCFVSVAVYYICLQVFGLMSAAMQISGLYPDVSLLFCDQTYVFQEVTAALLGADSAPALQCAVLQVFALSAILNAGLAVFNLIPIPPLDGSKILASLLPNRAAVIYLRAERYIVYALVAVALLNVLGGMIPLLGTISDAIFLPITFLREGLLKLFESLMQLIFR